MKKVILTILLINCLYVTQYAQFNFPSPLGLNKIEYVLKDNVKETYDLSKAEKKAFLLFDMNSEALAEVMYNGCNFVFNEKKITIFPYYFTGQLKRKVSDDFATKIPIQLNRSIDFSIFKNYKLSDADFPILIVYNAKNELCGFSKNVEQISDIDCGVEANNLRVLRLKIMVEGKNKELLPYANKEVLIMGGKNNDTIIKVMTNKYGDFNTELTDLNQDYLIKVNEKEKKINFVILGTQSGKVLGKFQSTDKGFEYRIIQTELFALPDINSEEDIEMKIMRLKEKSLKDFVLTEILYYDLAGTNLSPSSKKILEGIKKVLDTYPEFNLKVVSHTDSQGDDESNLKLSEKRSETVVGYLNSLGIDSARLSSSGKGELEIRNRCVNNIDCSDKEHEYNRRTEFKFSKK